MAMAMICTGCDSVFVGSQHVFLAQLLYTQLNIDSPSDNNITRNPPLATYSALRDRRDLAGR
jgi:hypothetical protein